MSETAEMRVTIRASGQRPKYDRMAGALLNRIREFYEDPENERAFREWKAAREAKGE